MLEQLREQAIKKADEKNLKQPVKGKYIDGYIIQKLLIKIENLEDENSRH